MKIKILVLICVGSFYAAISQSALIWTYPYDVVIDRLKGEKLVAHPVPKEKFSKAARDVVDFLKSKHTDWFLFVRNDIVQAELTPFRKTFTSFPYVHRVFDTKVGTLVFTLKEHPNFYIKIDNRPIAEFDDDLRSYFSAYEKSQRVQKETAASYALLYFPYEYGQKSERLNTNFLISERIPVFSEREVDQLVLLHLMLRRATTDPVVKTKLRQMYREMLTYICKVDFDDINIRNVPFTEDGRLAPFDTDSFRAETGVFTFLQRFHSFKLFPTYAELEPIITSSCTETPIQNLNPYRNIAAQEAAFEKESRALNGMMHFVEDNPVDIPLHRKIESVVSERLKDVARTMDRYVDTKLHTAGHHKYFGLRCEFMRDFVNDISAALVKTDRTLNLNSADKMVTEALDAAHKEGTIFTSAGEESVASVMNKQGLLGVICF